MVRDLTQEELVALKQGLRSSDAFTLRRSQILLASNQGQTPQQVAAQLHCSDQCVREAIHAFHAEGLACLKGKSHATHRDQSALGSAGLAQLQELLHHSPRHFGQQTSLWTLQGLAKVSLAQGITSRQVSDETIRRTGNGPRSALAAPTPDMSKKGDSRPASPDLEGPPRLDVGVGR
jgi:transposase